MKSASVACSVCLRALNFFSALADLSCGGRCLDSGPTRERRRSGRPPARRQTKSAPRGLYPEPASRSHRGLVAALPPLGVLPCRLHKYRSGRSSVEQAPCFVVCVAGCPKWGTPFLVADFFKARFEKERGARVAGAQLCAVRGIGHGQRFVVGEQSEQRHGGSDGRRVAPALTPGRVAHGKALRPERQPCPFRHGRPVPG